ncbi:MAG TPA: HEAT repeat domain-containing protein [Fimbriimonas sp.]|nr:HEAT repeat domain-containing protein [Fimbriimonas sp.]
MSRQEAARQLLASQPSDADLEALTGALERDKGMFPAIEDTSALAALKKPSLKPFWESELSHESIRRRAEAVRAFADLPNDSSDDAKIRGLLDDQQPYDVVSAAIMTLDKVDYDASKPQILALASKADNTEIRSAALEAVLHHDQEQGKDLTFKSLEASQPDSVREAGLSALGDIKGEDPRVTSYLREALKSPGFNGVFRAINIITVHKMKQMIPDLEALKKKNPRFAGFIDQTIAQIKS